MPDPIPTDPRKPKPDPTERTQQSGGKKADKPKPVSNPKKK